MANLPGPTPPPLQAMADGLSRHVGPESSAFVDAVFSLHDADELRSLVEGAGFSSVVIDSEDTPLELGSPANFLWSYVASTPVAAAVAKIDEGRRRALERDYIEACEPYLRGGALQGLVRMTTVVATK